MCKGSLDAVEVSNSIIKVLNEVLTSKHNFTGRVDFSVNIKGGSIVSVNALEVKKVKIT